VASFSLTLRYVCPKTLTVSASVATLLAFGAGALSAVWLPLSSPNLLLIMLFAGIFAAAVPSYLFLAGIRAIGGVKAGILMLAQAPVGVALAAVFLDESIGPVQIPGYPDPFNYGPPPSADGDPPLYIWTWDSSAGAYVLED